MPVARFARDRMAERLGPNLSGDPKKPLLPVVDASSPGGDGKSRDLLSKFLAARDARPEFMTDTLVMTMAVSMAFAGSETTAISLAAVFYYLLKNPAKLARLRAEIDAASRAGAFSDHDTGLVTWAESQRLPYLDACVKEAFRMHPAAGLPLERIVPEPGVEIAGCHVKGGAIVGCSAWIIHRRPEIWGDDVDVYRPERWLVEEEEDEGGATPSLTDMEKAERERRIREMNGMMLQFGMGSRTCIGKNISLLEIYKVVPSLLRRFEVSLFFHFPFSLLSLNLSLHIQHLTSLDRLPPFPIKPQPLLTSLPTITPTKHTLFPSANGKTKKQIRFKDPSQEWKLVNAWFVKQQNFQTVFELRDLVKPDAALENEKAAATATES